MEGKTGESNRMQTLQSLRHNFDLSPKSNGEPLRCSEWVSDMIRYLFWKNTPGGGMESKLDVGGGGPKTQETSLHGNGVQARRVNSLDKSGGLEWWMSRLKERNLK